MFRCSLIGISLIFACSIQAQNYIYDRITGPEVKSMTIKTDFRKLIREKTKEIYQNGQLILELEEGTDTFDIELRARGNSRQSVCYYPPIKLKFSKKTLHIPEPNTVKLVNCCRNSDDYEAILWKEYLIYQLYRKLTDVSFRTQIFPITYIDVNKPQATYTRMGFLIEPEEEMAANLHGQMYEPKVTLQKVMDSTLISVVTVFQYIIGNTDWAIGNQHNMSIVRTEEHLPYPVPYDFDYAGLVNAGYAVPHESLPIKHVTERYNRSYCLSEAQCQQACAELLSKEEAMYAEIDACPGLGEREKKVMKLYLKDGYDLIRDERKAKQIFTRDCREWSRN